MRKVLLVAVVFIRLSGLYAQQIDSLEQLLQTNTLSDTARIDVLNTLGRELTFINPIKAAKLESEALQSSLRINYIRGQAYGYRGLSSIFSIHNKSIIAAEYLQRSMKIFQYTNDSIGIANCYISMGHAYRRSQRRSEEVEFHKRAYNLFLRLKIPDRIAVSAHNLGESYFLTGEYQKSRELTIAAIHFLSDSAHNLAILSNCYKVMGKLELVAQNMKTAEYYFHKVLTISDLLGKNSQKIATIESLIGLTTIYESINQRDRLLSTLLAASHFCDTNNLSQYLDPVYIRLLNFHSENKDSVIHYLQEFERVLGVVTKRSLQNQWEIEQFGKEIYEILENETRASEKKYILQEHRIKAKNTLLFLSLFAIIIFLALLLALVQSSRKQKKIEREIKYKSEQLRELAAHLQNVREEERIAVSQQVHEELGQQLIVIKIDAAWMKGELEKLGAPSKRSEETLKQLDTAIATIRRIATALRPSVLDDIGLEVAIKWHLSELESHYPFKAHFLEPETELNISGIVKTGLYRIFQEAMTYVAYHSKAQTVLVNIKQDSEFIRLIIEDDGIGFSRNEIDPKKNIGIFAMKERCYMMNGHFEITSIPGKGTRVTITVPTTGEKG